jgi:phosphoglycolate phosphatase
MPLGVLDTMQITGVILDLDGTLVDSSHGILASFAGAFQTCGLQTSRPLSHDIIGPPLLPTLRMLAGTDNPEVVDPLAIAFKAHYDTVGYRETRAYPQVETMLQSLTQASLPLYIATNKRKKPTDSIIDWLQWRPYFQAIYSLDTPQPAAPHKGALIQYLLQTHALPSATSLYVGDRDDDAIAAAQAGTPFFHATWGYESGVQSQAYVKAGDIATLLKLLTSGAR